MLVHVLAVLFNAAVGEIYSAVPKAVSRTCSKASKTSTGKGGTVTSTYHGMEVIYRSKAACGYSCQVHCVAQEARHVCDWRLISIVAELDPGVKQVAGAGQQ
jgi:hypothetical protein